MSKRTLRILSLTFIILLDMALAVGCFFAAFVARYTPSLTGFAEITSSETFQPYLSLMITVPLIRAFTYSVFRLYGYSSRRVSAGDIFDIFKAICLGTAMIIIVAFLYRGMFQYRDFSYSRFVFMLDWMLNLLLMVGTRTFMWSIRDEMRRRGFGLRRIAVQGNGGTARALLSELDRFPQMGFRVIGYIANDVDEKALEEDGRKFKHLGGTSDILDIVNEHAVEEVVVTNVGSLSTDLAVFVHACNKLDVVVRLIPDFYGILLQGRSIEELGGQPAIQINEIGIVGWARVLKRTEDVVLSTIALIVSAPLLVMVALLIKLESKGPVLFSQTRMGRNGRHFKMIKFRSMYADAEARRSQLENLNESDGLLFKMKSDPRITRVGNIIRKTSVDELPQIYNVLRGEMSLVGPRPLPVSDMSRGDEWEHIRLSVPPGLTGMWQVNRTMHTTEEMLKWDILYIENWSLWADIKIMFKTVFVILTGKSNY